MPVRFVCPSCQQPLEIDDQWAGQSVACPYCNRVVTAPTASTWPGDQQVPVASPARSGLAPPLPTDLPNPVSRLGPASSVSAWATALTLAGVGFILVAMITWARTASPLLMDKVGPPPVGSVSDPKTHDAQVAYQRKVFDVLQSGEVPVPHTTAAAMMIGLACSLIGLILAIKLIIQGHRRARGIIIALIALFCVACQGLSTLSILSLSLKNHLMK